MLALNVFAVPDELLRCRYALANAGKVYYPIVILAAFEKSLSLPDESNAVITKNQVPSDRFSTTLIVMPGLLMLMEFG